VNLPDRGFPASSYAKFRAVFGVWLAVHFAALVPWASELFSSAGALGDPWASPLARLFPNVLVWIVDPAFATSFVLVAGGASLLFAFGIRDRFLAVFLWYVWACLLGRNPLIANPGIPYVGWLLLMHAVLPRDGEDRAYVPGSFHTAAWIVMTVGYTYGGLTKLASPSWLDGSALRRVLECPLARDTALRVWLVSLPEPLLRVLTWATLTLEVVAAPLALSKRARPWLWGAFVALHLGILATVDFADLTLGMLMIHAVTFDPRWWSAGRESRVALSASAAASP
jgi:hypothetical protein